MRFDDLINKPKQLKPPKLSYTESLEAQLHAHMAEKPQVQAKFTALEWAAMEGGHSVDPK